MNYYYYYDYLLSSLHNTNCKTSKYAMDTKLIIAKVKKFNNIKQMKMIVTGYTRFITINEIVPILIQYMIIAFYCIKDKFTLSKENQNKLNLSNNDTKITVNHNNNNNRLSTNIDKKRYGVIMHSFTVIVILFNIMTHQSPSTNGQSNFRMIPITQYHLETYQLHLIPKDGGELKELNITKYIHMV